MTTYNDKQFKDLLKELNEIKKIVEEQRKEIKLIKEHLKQVKINISDILFQGQVYYDETL